MIPQIDKFNEQYKQELNFQEVSANKRTLNGFIWFMGAVSLIWLLTITDFFIVDKNLVSSAFVFCISLFLPAHFLISKRNLSKKWIKYCLLTLLCLVCGVIISLLTFHATLLYVFPLLYATQYRQKKIVWFTYFINLLTITCGMLTGFYYGLCDLNILLESRYPRAHYLELITENSLSLATNKNPTYIILMFAVIPAAIILFIVAIMLQYTVISNTEDAVRIAQLTYAKDTDTNTGVFNKNKYEEMISSYYPNINRLAVTFFDLNNLKQANDEFGHSMGDYIIATLASYIRSHANDGRRVYRIGGDEFVMILENPIAGEAELIISAVKKQISKHNKNGPVAISTAAGFAYGNGSDILEIVKQADEAMYEDKARIKASMRTK